MSRIRKALYSMLLVVLMVSSVMVAAAPAHAAYRIYNNSGSVGPVEVTCTIGGWPGTCRVYPGQTFAGYTSTVVVRQGQCVHVEYRGTFCPARGSISVSVPNYSHVVYRSR